METHIQNYRNLMQLSDAYLSAAAPKRYVQELMWIENMLDRAKVVIAEMARSEAEKETSHAFTKEVYQYLDNVIRPDVTALLETMSIEEKKDLKNALNMSLYNLLQWARVS